VTVTSIRRHACSDGLFDSHNRKLAWVDPTLNVYTQVIDGAKLAAAQAVGNGLIEIERNPERAVALIH
jgi:hypothetical protein